MIIGCISLCILLSSTAIFFKHKSEKNALFFIPLLPFAILDAVIHIPTLIVETLCKPLMTFWHSKDYAIGQKALLSPLVLIAFIVQNILFFARITTCEARKENEPAGSFSFLASQVVILAKKSMFCTINAISTRGESSAFYPIAQSLLCQNVIRGLQSVSTIKVGM